MLWNTAYLIIRLYFTLVNHCLLSPRQYYLSVVAVSFLYYVICLRCYSHLTTSSVNFDENKIYLKFWEMHWYQGL